jgi:hypothetical protein
MTTVKLASVIAFAALAATPALGSAANLPPTHGAKTHFGHFSPPKPPKPVLHVPLGIYENWSAQDGVLVTGGTVTPVDPGVTFKCTNANGCTVIGHLSVQFYTPTDGAHWSLCMVVDGNYANRACYYQGVQNVADEYVMGNDRQNASVSKGTHTVSTYIYPEFDGYVGTYQNDYEITTP